LIFEAKAMGALPLVEVHRIELAFTVLPRLTVTVENGSGGGRYVEGTQVYITAFAPQIGYKFKEWEMAPTVDFINHTDERSTRAVFIMPDESVEVKAIFEPIPDNEHLIAIGVIGNGFVNVSVQSAAKDTVVTLSVVPDRGSRFVGWIVAQGDVQIVNNEFVMPDSEVVILAEFADNTPPPMTANSWWAYQGYSQDDVMREFSFNLPTLGTFDGGWRARLIPHGEAADTLSFGIKGETSGSIPNWHVGNFKIEAAVVPNHDLPPGTYSAMLYFEAKSAGAAPWLPVARTDITFTVVPTYAVTVSGGIENGIFRFPEGAIVHIVADEPQPGEQFIRWEFKPSVTFVFGTSASSPIPIISMPGYDIEATAIFEPILYPVTVNNGTGSDDYAPGAVVQITADTPPSGQRFKEWAITPEVRFLIGTSAASPTARFTMPNEAVTATAVFEPIPHQVIVTRTGKGVATPDVQSAPRGTKVTLKAVPDKGNRFVRWETIRGGVTLSSRTAATATFTMPENDVEIRAVFEKVVSAPIVSKPAPTPAPAPAPGTTPVLWRAAAPIQAEAPEPAPDPAPPQEITPVPIPEQIDTIEEPETPLVAGTGEKAIQEEEGSGVFPWWLLILIIAAVCCILFIIIWRKRRQTE